MPDHSRALNLVFEDSLHKAILTKIVQKYGRDVLIGQEISRGGRGYIKKIIRGLHHSANASLPFLVLVDLDTFDCAPSLIQTWFGQRRISSHMQFRVAVKEAEAWLLADMNNLTGFLHTRSTPRAVNPDLENDPKRTIVDLANHSRLRKIREYVGNTSKLRTQGPLYNLYMNDFVFNRWDTEVARKNSDSLDRSIRALENYISI